MDSLKQELEIDDHKIPIADLYRRLKTNPDTVGNSFIYCFVVRARAVLVRETSGLLTCRSIRAGPNVLTSQRGPRP